MIERRCAACKYLRRRCALDCIFSSYFPSQDPQRFACVPKIYGASNVAKWLRELPENVRTTAADAMHYSAQCRVKDPVYGCVGLISILQDQIFSMENELAITRAQLALHSSRNYDEFQP